MKKLEFYQLPLTKKILILSIAVFTGLITFFCVHIYFFNINSPTKISIVVWVILWFGFMNAIEELRIFINNKLK
jgi:hypothetical protein